MGLSIVSLTHITQSRIVVNAICYVSLPLHLWLAVRFINEIARVLKSTYSAAIFFLQNFWLDLAQVWKKRLPGKLLDPQKDVSS